MLDTGFFLDTIIQFSNTSTDPVTAWCFYENANSHCTNSGEVCIFAEECCDPEFGCGQCLPGWNETDFHVRLTPRQPLGWIASEGMAGFDPSSKPPKDFGKFPLDGVKLSGIGGSSNAAAASRRFRNRLSSARCDASRWTRTTRRSIATCSRARRRS